MAAQSDDWPALSEALGRLDTLASNAAGEIVGRGEIPIYALRSDLPGSITPQREERRLAQATRTFVSGDEIRARYEPGQDIRSILGPRSNMQSENVVAWVYGKAACTVTFRSVRVHWTALVNALAGAGYAVSAVNAPEALLTAEPVPAIEQTAETSRPLRGTSLADELYKWARRQWGEDLKKLPNRDALLTLARKEPELRNVTQQDIRDLRRRLAPYEIRRGGGGMHRRS
jgi:hypothetical protein